jgi:hypothetical protein
LTLARGRVCPGVSGDSGGGGRGEHDTVVVLVRGAGAGAAAAMTVVVLEGGGGSVSAIEELGGWVRISRVEQMRGATFPDLPIRYFSPQQQQRSKELPSRIYLLLHPTMNTCCSAVIVSR